MSDAKLSELTEATSVDDDDVLYVVNDDGSRKVQVETLLGKASSILAASAASGSTTITLPSITPWMVKGSIIAIDPYNVECELGWISSVDGTTVTISQALTFAHDKEDPVLLIDPGGVSVKMWGAKGDSSTDDWAAVQRAFHECDRFGLFVVGDRQQYQITQPLFLNSSHLREIVLRCQANSFEPIDELGAAVTHCQNPAVRFTATASDNTFTTVGNSNVNVGNLVAFNNPTGETLPGGITSGRWYYVKSKPSNTTFTISATSGGTTLDITSDGAGWAYPDVNTLGRIYFDDVYIKGGTGNANLNILRADIQQPGYTRNLRIDGAVGGGGVCFWLSGQISNHYNMELNPNSGAIGLQIGKTVDGVNHFSSGHSFFGLNVAGTSVTGETIGIWIANGNANHFSGLWTEGAFAKHILLGDGSTTSASQTTISGWLQSGGGTTALELSNHFGNSVHLTDMAAYTTATNAFVDNKRSLTLTYGGAGNGKGIGEVTFPGGTKGYPLIPSMEPFGSFEDPSNATMSADNKIAFRFICPRSGYITGMKIKLGSSTTANVKAVIYSDDSGSPDELLATSDELSVTSSREWRTFTFSTPLLVRGGTRYWIGWISDQETLYSYWQESPTTNGQGVEVEDTYSGGASDPFGTGTAQNVIAAIYTVYG